MQQSRVAEQLQAGGEALARAWTLFGDFMRDEAGLMAQAGLVVIERREFGALDGIRLVVGRAGQD